MAQSSSELNTIHLRKLATPGKKYFGDDEKVYIGTENGRLKLEELASSTVFSATDKVDANNVQDAIENIANTSNETAQDAVGSILLDTSTIDFTYSDATPSIKADLKNTTVVPATYGSATQSPQFIVDAQGRLISAINVPIALSPSAISLTQHNILVGNASNIATGVSMSGEASIVSTGALTLLNSAVIGKLLTGYISGAGVVAATDSILSAIQKLNGNTAALVTGVSSVFGRTGAVSALSGDYTTTLVTEGTNLYYTQTRFDSAFSAKTTTNLTEGTNLYFTTTRTLNTALTGLNLGTGGSISAADTVLQAFGKIQNVISSILGGVIYQATWNASLNSPAIVSSVGTKGYYYVVSVAGATNINGITDWKVGDWIIYNGAAWEKVDNTDAVSSVNGQVGAVSLTTSNITEGTNLYYTDARSRASISLTTTGASGASTYNNATGILNVPAYTLAGLGGQPLNTNLTSLSGLSYVSASFVKMTAAGTFSLDTNVYLTGNQTITLSGDVSGSGTTAIIATLATVNSNIGTWNNVTVNAKGLVTAGSNVAYLTSEADTLTTVTGRGNITATGIQLTENGNLATSYSLYGKRNTDTAPLGFFMQFQNAAALTNLFTVDVTGAITTGIWNGTNVAASAGGTGFGSYTRGDMLYSPSTGGLAKLNIVAAGSVLLSGLDPAWGKVGLTTHVSGTLAATNGGTGLASYVLGDTLYSSAANTLSALAGNITTTLQVLTQTGTGVVSAAPAWTTLSTTNVTEGTNLYYTNARVNAQVATYTGDVTLTGTVFAVGLAKVTNAMLVNSSITIGTTVIALGGSSLTLGGLTSVTSTGFTGALTGNASTSTSLSGGLGGQIPYQLAASTTAFLSNGTAGQVLTSSGTTLAPTWTTPTTGTVTSVTGSGNIASSGGSAPNITFTGILSVANGGTGSSTQSNWTLLGNAGTVAGTNFIGTTDSVDFRIRTNNTEKLSVTSAGNVGIGIVNPAATLDALGTFRVVSGTHATGGTITYSGAYTIHTFTSLGTFTPNGAMSVEYLVVAGGGGGGRNAANSGSGGGGAGGLLTGTQALTATAYAITVGAGGASETNGANSSIAALQVATGGGKGGSALDMAGSAGGCGGGGSGSAIAVQAGGAGTAGQGTSGGNGGLSASAPAGGGGGGAGAAGTAASISTAGAGGIGLANSISGTSVTYAGGGGGSRWNLVGTNAVGGSGIGGAGVDAPGTGGAGVVSTGSGGGAGAIGGAGGSGIVIIRYLTTVAIATTSTGNVGINTTAPTNKLTVVGGDALINTLTFGLGAGSIATNTAIGVSALNANTTGGTNTAIGYESMALGTISSTSVAVGYRSLKASTDGYDNVGVGYRTLEVNTTGFQNTSIGGLAGGLNTTGAYNTNIGRTAGYSNISGNRNVNLGYQAGYYETGSDKLFIDNAPRANEADGRVKALVYGVFNAIPANQSLTVNGLIKITEGSPGSGKVLTSDATGLASWTTPASGISSLSAIGATPNANGATITGTVLNLQPASTSFGGVVTTGVQSFTGAKTFTLSTANSSTIDVRNTATTGTLAIAGNFNVNGINAGGANYGLNVTASGGGSNYGLFLQNTIVAGTNNYAVYSEAPAQSYFAGNVGIGILAPTATVEVAGNIRMYGSANNKVTNNKILYRSTTDATVTELTTDGAAGSGTTNRIVVPLNTTMSVVVNICIKQSGSVNSKQMLRQFLIVNNGGTTQIEGTVTTLGTDVGSAALTTVSTTITANDTDDAVKIEVTGLALTNLRYTAFVVSTETTY